LQTSALKYWPFVLAFVAVAVWMMIAGRTPTGDEGLYTILTDEQYEQTLARVRELTKGPLIAYDSGQKLTNKQLDDLREGRTLVRRLIAYQPRNFPPYVIMGKTQRALGEMDEAVRNYEQALLLMPEDSTDPDVLWTAADVRYDLGVHYYNTSDYATAEGYAEDAVARAPTNAAYMASLGAIKSQLGKLDEARYWTSEALKYDPNDLVATALDEELKKAGR
jgi:tetratricopeptide (TPR) repeat protein